MKNAPTKRIDFSVSAVQIANSVMFKLSKMSKEFGLDGPDGPDGLTDHANHLGPNSLQYVTLYSLLLLVTFLCPAGRVIRYTSP